MPIQLQVSTGLRLNEKSRLDPPEILLIETLSK